jgi:dihydrofolate reductase
MQTPVVRKIIESTLVTLDGVIEDPSTWAGDYLDDEFQKGALERLTDTGAMLMGRRTYEMLARDWAAQSGDFANRINSVRKYVFSSTLEKVDWNNSIIVRGDVVRQVSKLKEQTGLDLAVYGHGLLAQTLLKGGLLDEMRLSIFPLFVGSGEVLFRKGENTRLRLIEATTLPTGVVVMRYQPVGTLEAAT